MKHTLLVLLSLWYAGSYLLHAADYPDRGFYGSLNFYYIDDKYETGQFYNAQQDFVQEYKLGYIGNIYSPRLLDYTLEGLFRIEDIKTQNTGSEGKTNIKSQDYKINMNFIKETNYPFTVYAQKTDRPVSTIYSTSSTRYEQELERYGLQGALKFDLFTVAYGATRQKSLYDRLFTYQEIESDLYKASIRRSKQAYSYQLGYSHLERNVNTTTLTDSNISTNEVDDTVDFTYRWKISDTLTFNSDARYTDSEYYKYKTTIANLYLRWRPKKQYNGSIAVSGSHTDHFSDTNDTRIYSETVDTLDVSQMFSYMPTSDLTFTENIGFHTYKTSVVEGDNANLRLGAHYNKQLTQDTRVRMSGSFDTLTNETRRKPTLTNDLNGTTRRNSYTLDARATVTEKLPSLRSTLDVGGNYYMVRTSLDEKRDRYSANLAFASQLTSGLRNRFDASYLNEQGRAIFLRNNVDEFVYRSVIRTDISEYLDYTTRLGVKGRVTGKLGLRYSDIENDGLHIERIVPRADLTVNYRFFQRLIVAAGAHADRDLSYNYMNYSGNASINYSIRKTTFRMGYQYYKTERTDDLFFPDYERTRFEIKLTRTF